MSSSMGSFLSSPRLSTQGALGDGDLMLICIAPDHEGKFGFNVKVGFTLPFFSFVFNLHYTGLFIYL